MIMGLLVFYFILAIGVSFFCSILEAVLLSVSRSYVLMLKKKHHAAGGTLQDFKEDIDRPLSAILSLNTIAHTAGAVGVGAQAEVVFGDVYVALTSAVLTLLILVISEIIPKTLGANYWRELAVFTARSLKVIMFIMYPLVVLSRMVTNLIAKSDEIRLFSREEFSAQVDIGTRAGVFAEKESRIFKNLIRFSSLRATDIMTPRIVVIMFDEQIVISQIIKKIEKLRVSRIPVYIDNPDNMTGYVLKDDLLLSMARGETHRRLRDFRRDISILPEMLKLGDVFESLLEKQEHIAILVDEYGQFSGLVTLEDVVETLLGMEIVDEVDSVRDMQVLARQRWQERASRLGLLEMSESINHQETRKDVTPE